MADDVLKFTFEGGTIDYDEWMKTEGQAIAEHTNYVFDRILMAIDIEMKLRESGLYAQSGEN